MDLKAVGRRIKAARENAGLTQEDLAAKANLSTTHISCIERGVKPPKLDTFVTIANAIGVSSDNLLQDVLDQVGADGKSDIALAIDSLTYEDQIRVRKIIRALASHD